MKLTVQHVFSKEDFQKSFEILFFLYPDMDKDQYMNFLEDMTGDYSQLQVYDEGKLVGVAGLWVNAKLFSGKYIEMDNVVVRPDYRSKGIGKLLCQETERIGVEKGCNLVVLDAYVENFSAHKFYYRQGYIARGYHFLKKLATTAAE